MGMGNLGGWYLKVMLELLSCLVCLSGLGFCYWCAFSSVTISHSFYACCSGRHTKRHLMNVTMRSFISNRSLGLALDILFFIPVKLSLNRPVNTNLKRITKKRYLLKNRFAVHTHVYCFVTRFSKQGSNIHFTGFCIPNRGSVISAGQISLFVLQTSDCSKPVGDAENR